MDNINLKNIIWKKKLLQIVLQNSAMQLSHANYSDDMLLISTHQVKNVSFTNINIFEQDIILIKHIKKKSKKFNTSNNDL